MNSAAIHNLKIITETITAAVSYAKRDGMAWSTGYTGLRSIAQVCGIDSDKWTKENCQNTYLDEKGRRIGTLPWELLVNMITAKLEETFFPEGGTKEELKEVEIFKSRRVWKGRFF